MRAAEPEADGGWAAAEEEAVRFTSDLIRIDTTNRGGGDGDERAAAEYTAALLEEIGAAPKILERSPRRSNVVARIPGTDPAAPGLLVHGHLDVVPAEPGEWTVHPFSGEVRDGAVWGRGAIDMKNADAMVLAAVRRWARAGVRPRRDIVLAFTADEEASAADGAAWLAAEHAELFADCTEGVSESGGRTVHVPAADGTPLRLYPVAAAERGTAWLRLTAHGRAGHGSRVNDDNAVGAIAAAVARIDGHAWPYRLTPVTRAALAAVADAVGVPHGLDEPGFDAQRDVPALLDRLGPAADLVRATLRESANPTVLRAGGKVNVIPGTATAGVDGRVLPGGRELFEAELDRLTGQRVTWEYEHSSIPVEAPLDSGLFTAMADALLAEDPAWAAERGLPPAQVVPVCMAGGTDAKHFAPLGIAGYGFTPLLWPAGLDYDALFHGTDERVPVEALRFGVHVLDRFLRAA
ncbi:M20/M25/M40 family metallo-hydrolase [Nocardiopsis coralliicola]